MVRDADRRNLSPSGWKWTALTPPPVTKAPVIATGEDSAPAGTVRVCGPTRIVPPADPIVCVADAYGRLEHCKSPVACRSEPIKSACGGGTGPSGGSPQLSNAAAVTSTAARVSRATFIVYSPG